MANSGNSGRSRKPVKSNKKSFLKKYTRRMTKKEKAEQEHRIKPVVIVEIVILVAVVFGFGLYFFLEKHPLTGRLAADSEVSQETEENAWDSNSSDAGEAGSDADGSDARADGTDDGSEADAEETNKYEVSIDEASDWLSEHKYDFSEEQILTAHDNEDFTKFLYRWKNGLYDLTESSEIVLNIEEINTYIPLFQQWDDRWGYASYGEEVIGTSGCGPTCMAMVASGLLNDASINPQVVAEYAMANDLYMWGTGTLWKLYEEYSPTVGILCSDLEADTSRIPAELRAGNPVIVSVSQGVFTYGGHFIVLTSIDEDGNITVNDPMSVERSQKTWKLSQFESQIKNAWSFHVSN